GAPDATLGTEEREDAPAAGFRRLDRLRRRRAVGSAALGDASQRDHELVGAKGLDEELARASEHRTAQRLSLVVDGHHHDLRARALVADQLGGRDARWRARVP